MSAADVARLLTLLLMGGTVGMIATVFVPSLRASVRDEALTIASIVAGGAMAASLYFSESAGFVPCELCWFQRIAMYPLAVLLPIATIRRERTIAPYALVLSLMGLAVSIYHVQLQLNPDQSTFCALDNPCSAQWVEAFGWATIPQMAGASFALIAALMTLALTTTANPDDDQQRRIPNEQEHQTAT